MFRHHLTFQESNADFVITLFQSLYVDNVVRGCAIMQKRHMPVCESKGEWEAVDTQLLFTTITLFI